VVDLLTRAQVARVVAAMRDPDRRRRAAASGCAPPASASSTACWKTSARELNIGFVRA